MRNKKKRALIMVTKYPEVGKVKTRLWDQIWMEKARIVTEKLIHYSVDKLSVSDKYDFFIYVKPASKLSQFSFEFKYTSTKIRWVQWVELWDAMFHIFLEMLEEYEQVILIWSDIPSVSQDLVIEWFEVLDYNDIVIWPARDWGYYLIWMKNTYPEIFKDIIYWTEIVYKKTMEKIDLLWLSYGVLVEKTDIYTLEDIRISVQDDHDWFLINLLKDIHE